MTWRLLAVHAHPDDESITMGGTLARYRRSGAQVTLVTCNLGEEGEIIPPELHGLEADGADQLGGYRLAELIAACSALGVTDHRLLGGLGCYRDSGMVGTPSAEHPRAFIHAGVDGPRHAEAVAQMVAVITEVRPHVLLTYEADGGYGHPDHVTAHRICLEAAERTGVPRVLAVGRGAAVIEQALADFVTPDGLLEPTAEDLGYLSTTTDVTIDIAVEAEAHLAALAAHRTQLTLIPGGFTLSNNIAQPLLAQESFRLLSGTPFPSGPVAQDLFAGLTV
ncbi:N-acetyl-1-D-myo-inositol-2-amino-2-deoxy-alpha-D-glucopyranoside deacetylase [Nakamurella silvestris]|nr:N-acetyl-1-D-myo-inositol-2-amino-2-deoxy-alpha-D-glucopyranoside deacetylase [Nakamurella silvestris]